MTWYSSGNSKVPDTEKDPPEAKCPKCGSRDIEESDYCRANDGKCDFPCEEWKRNMDFDLSPCMERFAGLECKHCGHVWREE